MYVVIEQSAKLKKLSPSGFPGFLKAAYQFIREPAPASTPPVIDEALIKKVLALITAHIEHPSNIPGLYRNHKVQVGDNDHGGIYTPLKCLPDIEKLMQEFILRNNIELSRRVVHSGMALGKLSDWVEMQNRTPETGRKKLQALLAEL